MHTLTSISKLFWHLLASLSVRKTFYICILKFVSNNSFTKVYVRSWIWFFHTSTTLHRLLFLSYSIKPNVSPHAWCPLDSLSSAMIVSKSKLVQTGLQVTAQRSDTQKSQVIRNPQWKMLKRWCRAGAWRIDQDAFPFLVAEPLPAKLMPGKLYGFPLKSSQNRSWNTGTQRSTNREDKRAPTRPYQLSYSHQQQ